MRIDVALRHAYGDAAFGGAPAAAGGGSGALAVVALFVLLLIGGLRWEVEW